MNCLQNRIYLHIILMSLFKQLPYSGLKKWFKHLMVVIKLHWYASRGVEYNFNFNNILIHYHFQRLCDILCLDTVSVMLKGSASNDGVRASLIVRNSFGLQNQRHHSMT